MNILHIDSSILGEHSVTRQLTAATVNQLRTNPAAQVVYRDVAAAALPHFPGTPDDGALLASVLDEVLAADIIVIGAPMYNFSVPSQLKSWLDALAVPGKTFAYDASGPHGLLGAKRVIIASARGGYYGSDTPMGALDHQESYLRSFLGFLGIKDIEIVRAEGVKVSDAAKDASIAAALQQVTQLKAA